MASELRPVMPADLFIAAIEGNSDVLIPRLELQPDEEPTEIDQTVQSELQSATNFGDTVLHLLVTRHTRLALKVFQRDRSLLSARNKLSETPLHCAAKVGNEGLISNLFEIDHVIMKDAIKKIDENGDTPLHVAAKYGHMFVGCKLMRWDKKIAHRVNNEMLFPLQIASMKKYVRMVMEMLEVDPTLGCIPFSDGMFPVHLSARMGSIELVVHFINMYPDYAKLEDLRGRNLFHIAAEENQKHIFRDIFKATNKREMVARMNQSQDYEGNTPLHIAAIKGYKSIMKDIWEQKMGAEVPNNEGLEPFQLHARQLETNEDARGRNLFHIAAENNHTTIFTNIFDAFKYTADVGQMVVRMNNATDNEGNTPLHIAAMKGHKSIMKAIWNMGIDSEIIENNEGLTPFKLSARQLKTIEYIDDDDIDSYVSVEGSKFTREWFDDVMKPPPTINKWEKTQVLGLGSVLITTVTFAAAFTIPGGYNQDNGTPVLGKRYMFRAFIVANTLAFIQGFISLLVLLWENKTKFGTRLGFATTFFLLAANCMVVAFGLGMYVTLAPICHPIAVLVLVVTLLIGSPVGMLYSAFVGPKFMISIISRLKNIRREFFVIVLLTIPFQLIFCLPIF